MIKKRFNQEIMKDMNVETSIIDLIGLSSTATAS